MPKAAKILELETTLQRAKTELTDKTEGLEKQRIDFERAQKDSAAATDKAKAKLATANAEKEVLSKKLNEITPKLEEAETVARKAKRDIEEAQAEAKDAKRAEGAVRKRLEEQMKDYETLRSTFTTVQASLKAEVASKGNIESLHREEQTKAANLQSVIHQVKALTPERFAQWKIGAIQIMAKPIVVAGS